MFQDTLKAKKKYTREVRVCLCVCVCEGESAMAGSSNGAATNGGGGANGNGTSFALQPHASITKGDGPLLLCILDGWGENTVCDEYNAVFVAETPTMDAIKEKGT